MLTWPQGRRLLDSFIIQTLYDTFSYKRVNYGKPLFKLLSLDFFFFLFCNNLKLHQITLHRAWFTVCIVSIKESTFRMFRLMVLADCLVSVSCKKWSMHALLTPCMFVNACVWLRVHRRKCAHSSVAWQPGRVCPLIHMILFGIDQAVFHPLPFSSLCPPSLLLSSVPSQGWMVRKMECAKPSFVFCLACYVYPDTSMSSLSALHFQYSSFQVFSFIYLSPLPSVFPLHFPHYFFFLIHLRLPLPLCCSLCLSHPLSLSLHRQFQFTSRS